ncbi:PTS system mannose/fructose/N-acetylgalactosamine-transporter subunit IIB [Catenisphaera adipataccumulans]|jgi:mannose/fructose/N-acetylgalactosamine-specific phosphotransferase system component IIB|uniref:PTS system mannose-specific IIB component n=1 Tax=Catenisphaera adipataccumulans TaxID=700500 RepID=A0A7W8CYK4_9FIRM|nr:PTS sugar transporter subunit IIB [Catenisphaera adipataccumulans]MBB5183329.1 PTS system mannose-specific IIB component [Catenisphaera adipataccumulans]
MSKIVLARIDDRLIHGQVMTAWVSYVGGKEILIVDDKVAKDPFLSAVIGGAAPKNLTVKTFTVDQAADYLSSSKDDTETILLAKGPETYLSLLEKGVPIKEINLGGMGSKQGRKKLYKNIAVSDAERKVFQSLMDQGVHVYIQVVPNMESVELKKVI